MRLFKIFSVRGPLLSASVAVSMAMMMSCRNSGMNDGSNDITSFKVSQDLLSASRSYRTVLYGDTVYYTVSTSMQWLESAGSNNIAGLQNHLLAVTYSDSASENVEAAITKYVEDVSALSFDGTAAPDSIVRVDTVGSPASGVQDYESAVNASISELSTQSVTYNVVATSYLGGAHPNTYSSPFTYMFGLNEVMTYNTLFKPGTEAAVARAVNEAAAEQYGAQPYRLSQKAFFNDTLTVSTDVYLSDGAIVFHYNPYDVAPYSEGMIDIEVYPVSVAECLTDAYRSQLLTE